MILVVSGVMMAVVGVSTYAVGDGFFFDGRGGAWVDGPVTTKVRKVLKVRAWVPDLTSKDSRDRWGVMGHDGVRWSGVVSSET